MAADRQRKTFLSYSRVNKDFAIKLAKELKSEGFDIWLDQLDIPAGSRWDREVEKALRESEIFMIILTKSSVDSENVLDEIGYAIDNSKRFLPVLLESCEVPLRLRRFQYVDFTNKSFDDGVESAKDLLRSLIAQSTIPQASFTSPQVQVDSEHKAKEEAERLAALKTEEERLAKEKADLERRVKEEAERLYAQKAEEERQAKAKADAERKAKTEARRKAKEEADRLAAQKAEDDHNTKEEAERLAAQKAEEERLARQKAEEELAAKAKEEANRLAAQKAEEDHLAKQKAEEEQAAKAKTEKERKDKEEAARLAAEKDHKAKEEQAAKARADRDAKTKAEQKAVPFATKATPVAASSAQKKPASKGLMYGFAAILVFAVAGIGLSALLNGKNNNITTPTQTTQATVAIEATKEQATQITAPIPTATQTIIPTPIGGGTGKIAFISSGEISIMNADGSGITRLVDGYDPVWSPAVWSPDGKHIAFVRNSDDGIYIMNADGTGVTRLVDGSNPLWSPDGKQLIYADQNIFTINTDGSNVNQLTQIRGYSWAKSPAWSPDGKRIVFVKNEDNGPQGGGSTNIYTMNADGSNLLRVGAAWNIYFQTPVWSPNGKYITFTSDRDGYESIYIMSAVGFGETNLTNNYAADKMPTWSPDGKKIVFVSNRDQPSHPSNCVTNTPCIGEIYIMNADGSSQTRLTNNTSNDYEPVWSPDGKYIAFVSDRDGNDEIYLMKADGSEQTRLTNNSVDDWYPVWQP